MDPFIATAVGLAQLGIKVFPIRWASKLPLYSGNWKEYATNNVTTLAALLPKQGRWNLAVQMGPASGILDMEMDGEHATREYDVINSIFGETPTVAYKSSRGVHYWFRWSPTLGELSKKGVLKYRGIELRLGLEDKGIYSVVPPSLHESREAWYQWLPGRSPWEVPIAEFPAHMVAIFETVVRQKGANRSVVEVTRSGDDLIPEPGQRHPYMLRLASLLHGRLRLPREAVQPMLMHLQDYVGKSGETAEKEISDILDTVRRGHLPDDVLSEIDFTEMYESATELVKDLKKKESESRKSLPRNLLPWMEDFADAAWGSQIPRNFFVMTMLTAFSSAIGASVDVRVEEAASPVGLQLYTLGVGESGSGKSRAPKKLLSPFLNQPGFCTDVTSESLTTMLAKNRRGVLLQIVEGKKFAKMLGRYNGAADGTRDNGVLLEAWSGDPIAVVRQDEKKNIRIDNPFLTVAAMIQPHNLRSFSVDDVMEGLLQRLSLYGADEVPEDSSPEAARQLGEGFLTYIEVLNRLRSIRPNLGLELIQDTHPDPTTVALNCSPFHLVLDDEAQVIWKKYAKWKRSEDAIGIFPEEHPFRTDMVRHAEIVLKFVGVLCMAFAASSEEAWDQLAVNARTYVTVPPYFLNLAIEWVEFTWSEKQHLVSDLVEDRYTKAMPERSLRTAQSLPEAMIRFAEARKRKLLPRVKSEQWTVRDYYRYLRLNADLAHDEILTMIQSGLVSQIGTKNRTPVYSFTEKVKELKQS
jgi:hypothetical protein